MPIHRRRAAAVGATHLYYLPVTTRVPLKFGPEVTTSVICARASVELNGTGGAAVTAVGWGETPLSVQWVWPSGIPYAERLQALRGLTETIAAAWAEAAQPGHPLEIGQHFVSRRLPELLAAANRTRPAAAAIPWLAALVCASAFDLATHDAYGKLLGRATYDTYGPEHLESDLATLLDDPAFAGRYPSDYLAPARRRLMAWHLVGGLDPLSPDELTGDEPDDGYPVLLEDWIRADGLQALKVKLRGDDAEWDYRRMAAVGAIAARHRVLWLSADFNCTVTEPDYVNRILDRLRDSEPRTYASILYVEQPFPYDLEQHQIDVRSVAARKPLFMDESAHDWTLVRLGRSLGWSGVALKTCKTQTGALLSFCWAREHGMTLMVQDLTNPMLAQIPHLQLAAHAGTIMGVETNAMQFYPAASAAEAQVHPGLYRRRDGHVDLDTLTGAGFGYRADEIRRALPDPVV
jgi:L-alanine-DL-glutamate epimerase-like enolase superfamily enzyme